MNLLEYIQEKKIFYLIVGFIFSIFSVGRFNFPLLIFVWPYCFLRFLHLNNKKLLPLIIVSVLLILSNMIRWIGIYNKSIAISFVAGLYFGVINIIPYIIDDIIYNKISNWASIFVFPLMVSFVEYVFEFLPIANYNVYAYALRYDIQIIQICSLFGSYFLSFIITLFASIVDYSYNLYKKEKKISRLIFFYVIIILIITSFGSIRLLIPEKEERYNIAATLGSTQCLFDLGKDYILPINNYTNYIQNAIIKANKSEAKVLLFAEEAFGVYAKDRTQIVDFTIKLAEKYNIFVVLSLCVAYDTVLKNLAILISNEGKVLYNYEKKNLIPIMEELFHSNMTEIKTFDTDVGNLGLVICYDISFPDYLNQLSRLGLDTLLIPSWDWDGITEAHSINLRYRAIENGFNTVKSTAHGITLGFDYKGRFLSYYQPNECQDHFILTNVYKRGTKTLYLYIGNFFNYLYLIAFIILVIIGRYTMNKEIEKIKIK